MHAGMLYITFWKNRSFASLWFTHVSFVCPILSLSLACWLPHLQLTLFLPFLLQVACMQFINALVTSPDELDLRLHIRNEYMRCGLKEILPVRFNIYTRNKKKINSSSPGNMFLTSCPLQLNNVDLL